MVVPPPSRRPGRRIPYWVAWAPVVLLVLSAAPAGASSVASVSLSAPYHRSTFAPSEGLTPVHPYRCAGAVETVPVHWKPRSGALLFANAARARSSANCTSTMAGSSGGASARASSSAVVVIPLGRANATRTETIVAHWSYDYWENWSFHHAACPAATLSSGNGYQSCQVSVGISGGQEGYPYLADLSTGGGYWSASSSFVLNNNSGWASDVYCQSYSCTWTNTTSNAPVLVRHEVGNFTLSWSSVSVKAGQAYALEFAFSVETQLYVDAYPSAWDAHANASFNLGSGGAGLALTSVTIS